MALAFAVVGLAVLVVAFVEYAQDVKTSRAVEVIQKHALVSVELVHRIGDDIHNERLLLDRHVFQHDAEKMTEVEGRIAQLRADYEEAARTYASLRSSPDEAAAWHAFTADVAAARASEAALLVISRQNRDADAIAALERLDPLYEKVAHDELTLDRINKDAANRAVDVVRRVQTTTQNRRALLLGIVLATVALVGGASTRSLGAQLELEGMNRTLAERNRDLDAFAGRLAHDLRGPLGSIGLASEVIADRFPDARSTVAVMDRSITQVSNLIDELLMLSRLGATPGATAEACAAAVLLGHRLEPLVAGAGGTLRVDLQPAAIACTESLLVQVLWNLGENAVKYRRVDVAPSIAIDGRVESGSYIIRVADNGIGIAAADTARVFEPFYRVGAQPVAGTGLGLAIVHRIVEVCRGTIAIDSTLGEGTAFTVSMPLATPA